SARRAATVSAPVAPAAIRAAPGGAAFAFELAGTLDLPIEPAACAAFRSGGSVLYSPRTGTKEQFVNRAVTEVSAMRKRSKIISAIGVLVLGTFAVAGCQSSGSTRAYTGTIQNPGGPQATEAYRPTGPRSDRVQGSETAQPGATVQVNRYAWRAWLDTIAFMPLASSDPYGGAISTDWYVPRANANERLRLNILVGGPELRGDTVRVTVFRQERKGGRGDWANVA